MDDGISDGIVSPSLLSSVGYDPYAKTSFVAVVLG
jgi:hypothetical protein